MSSRKMERNKNITMKTKSKNLDSCYLLTTKHNIFDVANQIITAKENGSSVIIPHVCNNINLFGAGFAKAIADKYPIVKENFHMLSIKAKLGYTQFVEAKKENTYGHKIIFANMIAQNGIKSHKNIRPLNYAALVYCMNNVKSYIQEFKKADGNRIEIHCPKFGSGLAGGDWKFISELIKDLWYESKNIYIYSL